ncbi:MAG: hypothetical protein JWR72_2707 [Flavisolibacter sp.]|jgi:hypothetical protein|nr:hypothetical protein [Flavisolibacter sp.]
MNNPIPIPKAIADKYGLCYACNDLKEICHSSELDKETQTLIKKRFPIKDGWVTYCGECDNFGIV